MKQLSWLVLVLTLAIPGFAIASPGDVFEQLPGAASPVQVRLLTRNHDAFYARWWVLDQAKSTIDCTYFGAGTDIIGRAFLGKLLQKARQGVKIRLMVDARGSLRLFNPIFHQDYLPALATFPNVTVRVYNDLLANLKKLPGSIVDRIAANHSKMVIVDRQWIVAGGRNLQLHWYTDPKDDPKSIRDADILARGASPADQATRAFEDEFDGLRNAHLSGLDRQQFETVTARLDLARQAMQGHMTGRPEAALTALAAAGFDAAEDTVQTLRDEFELFRSMTNYDSFVPLAGAHTSPVVVLGKHSRVTTMDNAVTQMLMKMIDAAEHEIVIASAYMVLTERARAALRNASLRGVKIRILTNSPQSSDSFMTQAWFVKEWKDYLRDIPNMRLFAIADKHKLHGKVFCFDGQVSVVGSYNLDPRSQDINAEDVAVMRSPEVTADLLAWYEQFIPHSLEYKIRVNPDGSVSQVTGPSDHCSRMMLWILRVVGRMEFLRPVV